MAETGVPIAGRRRVEAVDVLRGLVMVVMALDHTRDYFTSVRFDPLDLTQTTPALYYTRWITHLCAPAFVFLAGTGAFLSTQRGKTKAELSRFLWTRGLWLIVLEVTVVRFAWTFNLDYARATFMQVIWALGWAMIVLAGLIRLPTWAITTFGLVMVAGHNLLDGITPEVFGGHGPLSYGFWGWLWIVLHVQVPPFIYPLIPWVGVMALGYVFGGIYSWDPEKRRRFLWRLSGLVIAGFIVLRYIDRYGDPGYWHPQASGIFTVMSFMNLQKYPPSLLYLMATLGPCFGMLALFERWSSPFTRFVMVYGKVPMFYYILHLYLIHAVALVVGVLAGFSLKTFFDPFFFYPPEWGYSLGVVYLVWISVVLALYLPCRWFARVKATNRAWWLSYL